MRLFLAFLISFLATSAQSTDLIEITGEVRDDLSGQRISGVNVQIEGTQIGASTDLRGTFRITHRREAGDVILLSCLGYEDLRLEIPVSGSMGQLRLKEQVLSLGEVVVSPGSFSLMGDLPLSQQTMTQADMKMMSYGEDATRSVSRLPGVSSTDFSSKFTVRGGESDEVMINLDGMELIEPFHQRDFAGGVISVVDIEALSGIELLTGGFGAEYGDRQSAVFNMKTPSQIDRRRSQFGISPINFSLYSEGPMADHRGHYLASARRSLLDQAFKLANYDENMPRYSDILLKGSYQLKPTQRLSLHLLNATDATSIRDVAEQAYDLHDTKYSNYYSWLSLDSRFQTASVKSIVYGARLKHDRIGRYDKWEPSDKLYFQLRDKRDHKLFGIKQDLGWSLSERLFLKAGYELRHAKASYDYSYVMHDVRANSIGEIVAFDRDVSYDFSPTGTQAGLYLALRYKMLEKLIVESGLRHDLTEWTDDRVTSPRLNAVWAFNDHTFLRGGWGYYYQSQGIDALRVNFDETEFHEAELSEHRVIGLEHQLENGLQVRLDVYDKEMSHMSPEFQNLRDPLEVFPEARNDLVRVDLDGARSRGIEVMLKYDEGRKLSWWFSYAFAKAEEKVLAVNYDGRFVARTGWLPRMNNQDHTVNIDINWRPTPVWRYNLSWQYYSGWPTTDYHYQDAIVPEEIRDPRYSAEVDTLHFYADHGGFRDTSFPAYHRMDLKISRDFVMKHGVISAYFHLINVYNQENIRKIDWDVRHPDTEELVPLEGGGYQYFKDDPTWFSIFPVVGMTWAF
jgi:outer membrane receptor protein involved in Fe transport